MISSFRRKQSTRSPRERATELTDEFGVRQIELYHNPDGKVYCLLEGPDEDAIRNHHAALNVPCGDVHEVDSLL